MTPSLSMVEFFKPLGIRIVLAESYERIHRSNLVGMGIVPLQYLPGQNAQSLNLTGRERFTLHLGKDLVPGQRVTLQCCVCVLVLLRTCVMLKLGQKHRVLKIEEKADIIRAIESGTKKSALAREKDLSLTTVCGICNSRVKLLGSAAATAERCRLRGSGFSDVEEALVK
ncbi:hypothetical protein HPB51_029074 [Rhipicephalus microplus]|uniref:Aconitase A/isopropylmalate dehydratase small subunit swivel domain-containing protein n=1 Tax=Rhipicephalus microplus TaxID=6941 RepID=A0A9J6CVP2_RHIMP|nr:hypothetical protein HPB51_029074 [Rhipicephalus microplus]